MLNNIVTLKYELEVT